MSLPRMTTDEAKDFASLMMDARFKSFWKRLEAMLEHIGNEILLSSTSRERREALVSMRETLITEVMNLPREVSQVLEAEEKANREAAGQAETAPV